MRFAALVLLPALAACVVQKPEIRAPYAAARFDSSKSASAFGACAAAALGEDLRSGDGALYVVISSQAGVQVARWDFIATLNGSQAELRTGIEGDVGAEKVRACA